jgi:hypothetical protein
MAWEVEVTDQFEDWYRGLADRDVEAINKVVDILVEKGPALTRPLVGEVVGSRFGPGLKELIAPRNLRVLFRFDPRRTAILLVGGDKTDRWKGWYVENIAAADRLFDEYLQELRKEGAIRT